MKWPNQAQKEFVFKALDYTPFPEQWPIHKSSKNLVQVIGAEGSGKSQVAANEITSCIPDNERCRLVYLIGETYINPRKEFEYLRDNLLRLGLIDLNNVSMPKTGKCAMTTLTGCRIETLSAQEGASAVIATGEEADIYCLTEAGIIQSYSMLTACVRRATRNKGRVLLVGTLADNFGWYASLVDELQVPDNLWNGETFSLPAWINTKLYPGGKDNPEIIRLRGILPDEEFQRTIAAQRVPSKALIFPEFSYAQHVRDCPFDPDLPVHIWIDPGYYPSAYVVLAVQYHGSEVWLIDEIYVNHHTHQQVIGIAKSLKWWFRVERAVMDFAGRQHHAEKSAEEVWRGETGLYCHSQQVGILDGISRHRSFLGPVPRLYHDPSCTGTLSEYRQYKRRTDKDGNPTSDEPIDKDNHSMKAIAYGLIDRFGFTEFTGRAVGVTIQDIPMSTYKPQRRRR